MIDPGPLQSGYKAGGGRFTLVRALGRGGMGEVWLAQDERLNELVALKFLPPEVRADPVALDDLRRETARSHRLTHPNIVRIHDLHEEPGGMAFIAMEYVDGPTLAGLRLEQPERVLSWEFLRPLVQQLCAALDYAHGEKVIHRDLKPANVMVDGKGRLKLADFGIAATVSDSLSRVSGRHATSGTLPYMSPQQLAGKHPRVADDIYALGATLYELLTSKPPFYTGDITHQVLHEAPEPPDERLAGLGLVNAVPPDVAALIMACLAKEPAQRPQSTQAVAAWIGLEVVSKHSLHSLTSEVFGEAEAGESLGPSEAGDATPPPSSSHRKFLLAGVAAAALVLVALGGWYRTTRPPAMGGHRAQPQAVTPEPESSRVPVQPTPPPVTATQDIPAAAASTRWTNSLGQVFVPVPGTKVFFCIWETRVQDFEAFVNETGHDMGTKMDAGEIWRAPGFKQTPLHAVVGVSWQDAQAFCNWLTAKERQHGRLGRNQSYRLPTDAEWSQAVGQSKYPWGDTWPPPAGAGNYAGEEARTADWPASSGVIAGYRDGFARTAPVGSFAPNQHGLFDMGGNVWEWVEDFYRKEMNTEAVRRNFRLDDGGGQKYRALRGGSWFNDSNPDLLLSSFHHAHAADSRDHRVGFRLACEQPAGNGAPGVKTIP